MIWSGVISLYGWVVIVEEDLAVLVFPQERLFLSSSVEWFH